MRRRFVYAAFVAGLAAIVSISAAPIAMAGGHARRPAAHPAPTHARSDIRIGLLLASGPHAAAANDIAAGLDLALAEAGRAVGGRHLVVIREDGDGASQDAATRARGLIAASAVDVLVGPATQGEIAALGDVADQAQMPLIVPVPDGPGSAGRCSPYVFHLVPSDDQVAGLLGSWVGGRKPAKHVYMLVPQDKAGHARVDAFQRQVEAAGGQIVGQESVGGQNPEFSPYLAKLRLMGADTMYAPFAGAAAKALAADYQQLGLAKQVTYIAASGPAPAPGSIRAIDYMPILNTPENHRFRTAVVQRFGRPATEQTARGYDAGRAIIEALRAAHGRVENAGGFAALLPQVSFTGPRGPIRGGLPDQIYIVRSGAPSDPPADELVDLAEPAAPAPADACHASPRT